MTKYKQYNNRGDIWKLLKEILEFEIIYQCTGSRKIIIVKKFQKLQNFPLNYLLFITSQNKAIFVCLLRWKSSLSSVGVNKSRDKTKLYKNNSRVEANTTVLIKPARVAKAEERKTKMASRDLEKEFDPTQWSSRIIDPKLLLETHVEFGNRGV